MTSKTTKLRVARPTDNLNVITQMYIDGLGFELLSEFKNHKGFDGAIVGHANHNYHLEFTHHHGTSVGRAPTQDNLLIFYVPIATEWRSICKQMIASGFKQVSSYNPYWDDSGTTFEDVDGYRVVIQNSEWNI